MYMCICMCIYIYTYVCIYIYIYIYIHTDHGSKAEPAPRGGAPFGAMPKPVEGIRSLISWNNFVEFILYEENGEI